MYTAVLVHFECHFIKETGRFTRRKSSTSCRAPPYETHSSGTCLNHLNLSPKRKIKKPDPIAWQPQWISSHSGQEIRLGRPRSFKDLESMSSHLRNMLCNSYNRQSPRSRSIIRPVVVHILWQQVTVPNPSCPRTTRSICLDFLSELGWALSGGYEIRTDKLKM